MKPKINESHLISEKCVARELLRQVGEVKHIWLCNISNACLADEMHIWAELSQTRPCGLGLVVLFQRVLTGQTQRRGVRRGPGRFLCNPSQRVGCYFQFVLLFHSLMLNMYLVLFLGERWPT